MNTDIHAYEQFILAESKQKWNKDYLKSGAAPSTTEKRKATLSTSRQRSSSHKRINNHSNRSGSAGSPMKDLGDSITNGQVTRRNAMQAEQQAATK